MTQKRKTRKSIAEQTLNQEWPKPVKFDSRICFAIAYFDNEADAQKYDELVRQRGDTYNGGWFHGRPCGRDKTWDHVDRTTGKQLYAVTT